MFYSQDYLGESVPEETFSYPLTPIMIISYPLSTSSIFCNPCYPLCLVYYLTVFLYNLCPSCFKSTSWSGTLWMNKYRN